MTPFDRCWSFLQRSDVEGGEKVSEDPDDPGGATHYGISQRAYPDIDIRSLTEAQARVIFCRDYWDVCRCDELPDALAIAMGDTAFNQGAGTAIQLLQDALGVKVDGVFGPVTLRAAQRVDVNEFLSRRLMRYADSKAKYRRGWFLRVLKLKDAIQ
jgi:lysozyme family protein